MTLLFNKLGDAEILRLNQKKKNYKLVGTKYINDLQLMIIMIVALATHAERILRY